MADKLGSAIAKDALLRGALTVLLDRAGGSVTYTEAEYQVVAAAFGGTSSLGISIEVVDTSSMAVRLSLVRKDGEEAPATTPGGLLS